MNRNDIIDILTVVAANDRRTVGTADVDVWQAVIGDLSKDLALRAIREHFRNKPGVWLEPGHVYQNAKAIRRDELDRNPEESYKAIAARAEGLATKAAEDIEELAERKGIPTEPKYVRRGVLPEMRVKCPWCKAGIGRPCVVPGSDRKLAGFHPSRKELAADKDQRGGAA